MQGYGYQKGEGPLGLSSFSLVSKYQQFSDDEKHTLSRWADLHDLTLLTFTPEKHWHEKKCRFEETKQSSEANGISRSVLSKVTTARIVGLTTTICISLFRNESGTLFEGVVPSGFSLCDVGILWGEGVGI